MRRLLLLLLITVVSNLAVAQESDTKDWARKGMHIPEVAVYGNRPIKEIGTQQTKFDTLALKE